MGREVITNNSDVPQYFYGVLIRPGESRTVTVPDVHPEVSEAPSPAPTVMNEDDAAPPGPAASAVEKPKSKGKK